jgi:hypothetical protein
MNTMKKGIVLIIMHLVVATGIWAQQHEERVIVVKSYNPVVDDAFKININPQITDTITRQDREVAYEITPVKLNTNIEVPPIQAAKMRGGLQRQELYRFFLKSGFGNYTTPYFELFYNSLRSRIGSHGIHYRHFSSHGKIEEYAFPGFSDNEFNAHSTFFGRNLTFHIKGDYNRNVVHFYGRPDTLMNDTLDKSMISQRFHRAGLQASMAGLGKSSRSLQHNLGLRYKMVTDNYETIEHAAFLKGEVKKEVKWFNFSRYQIAGIGFGGDFYNTAALSDTLTTKQDQLLVRINPHLSTRLNDLEIKVGALFGYESANNGKLHFFPDVHLKIALGESKFLIMGGLDGDLERNSFDALAAENPFVISNPGMKNSITKVRVYGGLRTAIGDRVNFTARVSSESLRNIALFSADTSLLFQNRFQVLYDDGNLLTLKAEVNYTTAEKLNISWLIMYRDFNLKTETYAWHEPAFNTRLDVKYNLGNKILANAGVQYLAGIKVQSFDNKVEVVNNLPNILDINLGIEYRYSSLISGFLRLNNLAASRYYRWQHYPGHRFNFLLGVTYAL